MSFAPKRQPQREMSSPKSPAGTLKKEPSAPIVVKLDIARKSSVNERRSPSPTLPRTQNDLKRRLQGNTSEKSKVIIQSIQLVHPPSYRQTPAIKINTSPLVAKTQPQKVLVAFFEKNKLVKEGVAAA